MRYHALACDYDGTIAWDGKVDANTIAALETVRGWRFDYPSAPTGAPLFVYAVIGFREPVTP